jgi:peptide/nickel transport system ATP-binding protein
MDLRGRLRRGALDVEELLERHGGGETTPDATDERAVDKAVRAEFDLPDRLSDPSVESTLAEALSDVADGDLERARERLAEAFPTVCEREHPELRSVGPDRTAACHLHDEARIEEPPPAED